MVFDITTLINGTIVEITLSGELDANSAPRFRAELEVVAAGKPTALVLRAADLMFIASAGIRVLIFAKQKMGVAVTVYMVAPQEQILDTLRRTGLLNTVVVVEKYPAVP